MTDSQEEVDAYLNVRALIFARKWARGKPPLSDWIVALADSGFLNFETRDNASQAAQAAQASHAMAGLEDVLAVAEIFGGYTLPVLFAPTAAAALALSEVSDTSCAARLVADFGGVATGVLALGKPPADQASLSADQTLTASIDAQGRVVFDGDQKAAERAGAIFETAKQLAAAAELAGAGAALLIRAGAEVDDENTIADALMDVMLARALVFGSVPMVLQNRDGDGVVGGAYAAAANAALTAAGVALAGVHDEQKRQDCEMLAVRANQLMAMNGAPEIHQACFLSWCADRTVDEALCSRFNTSMSADIIRLIDECAALRASLAEIAPAGNREAHTRLGVIERDVLGLVCADAQRQAGGLIKSSFIDAAAERIRQRLTDCTLSACGAHAGGQYEVDNRAAPFTGSHS